MLTDILFVVLGLLIFMSAAFVGRFFSDAADRWQRDGAVRNPGGLSRKIWREDSPIQFDSRVQGVRFSAAFARLFLKGSGAIFVIVGIVQMIGLLIR
jgi:hypothetical protein